MATNELLPVRHDTDGNVRCRVCGCTEIDACNPSCGWAADDKRGDLCTNCAEVLFELVMWSEGAHRPSRAALMRELDHRLGQTGSEP
jgi:hypothetical protein